MKDIVISAKLISWNSLRLTIFYDGQIGNLKPNLVEDDTGRRIPLFPVKASSTASLSVYEFRMEEPLILGHPLFLEIESLGRVALDVSEAASFENFDRIYHYEGKLGAEYQKDKTRFAIFAPLACSVILMIAKPDQVRPDTFPMDRINGGAYETVLEGDYEGARYWWPGVWILMQSRRAPTAGPPMSLIQIKSKPRRSRRPCPSCKATTTPSSTKAASAT